MAPVIAHAPPIAAFIAGADNEPLPHAWAGCFFLGSFGDACSFMLSIWVVAELLFYVWYRVELHRAQALTSPPKVLLEDRNWLLEKMFLHAEHHGMWRQVQGWFLTKDRDATHSPHEVGRDDLKELMAWAFFYKHVEDVDATEMVWLDSACDTVAKDFQLDHSIRPGRSGVVSVRHTLDTIRVIHRPLMFYLCIRLIGWMHGLLLQARGFRKGRHEGLRYWYRLPQEEELQRDGQQGQEREARVDSSSSEETVLFFHGIGIGLALYLPLLLGIRQRRQMLFEMPWISMDPFARIASNVEYANWVVEALNKHGVDKCVAVGHSFGSMPVAWLLRQHPGRIPRCVLIDPVSIFLNLPDVCVNFLYREPKTVFGKIIRLFGAREFGIARTLMRHFFWTNNVLFPEMLPPGSSVILMGEDRVLPVKDIYTGSVKVPGIRTIVLNGFDHGQFLMVPSAAKTIIDHIDNSKHCVGDPY